MKMYSLPRFNVGVDSKVEIVSMFKVDIVVILKCS